MDPVISGHRKFRQTSGSIIHTSFGPGRIVHIYLYTVYTVHIIYTLDLVRGALYNVQTHAGYVYTKHIYAKHLLVSANLKYTLNLVPSTLYICSAMGTILFRQT